MQHDARAAPLGLDRGGETGYPRSDNDNPPEHQIRWRATIHSRRARGVRTRVRGRSKPRFRLASSTVRYAADMMRGARTCERGEAAMIASD